jgi:hypothetical protein
VILQLAKTWISVLSLSRLQTIRHTRDDWLVKTNLVLLSRRLAVSTNLSHAWNGGRWAAWKCMGGGIIAPPFLTSALMELSDQLHTPGRFTPRGKSSRHPLGRKLGGSYSRSGRCRINTNLLPLLGIESLPSCYVARRYTDWAISAPFDSFYIIIIINLNSWCFRDFLL